MLRQRALIGSSTNRCIVLTLGSLMGSGNYCHDTSSVCMVCRYIGLHVRCCIRTRSFFTDTDFAVYHHAMTVWWPSQSKLRSMLAANGCSMNSDCVRQSLAALSLWSFVQRQRPGSWQTYFFPHKSNYGVVSLTSMTWTCSCNRTP